MRMQMYNVYMIIRYSQSADGRDWKPTIIYLIWILQFKHDLKILVFFCSKHETNLRIEKKDTMYKLCECHESYHPFFTVAET